MPLPSSVKFTRHGITYLSNVDRTAWTIKELSRAALRDVGKFVCNTARKKTRKRYGGGLGKTPAGRQRAYKGFGYWVRKIETDLQVGSKSSTWYGVLQELGDEFHGARKTRFGGLIPFKARQPRRAILTTTVRENIETIRKIEAQYLSAVEDENRALGLIDEREYRDNETNIEE